MMFGSVPRGGVSMHTNHVRCETCVRNDMLEHMMDMQKELQERMGYDFELMTIEDRTAYIKEFTLHATDELHEMLRELPFLKPWKKYNLAEIDIPDAMMKAREEYVDVIHIVMNLGIALQMTPFDVYMGYLKKNEINHKRQDNTAEYKGIK